MIPASIVLFGVPFHLYGLFIGAGLALGLHLADTVRAQHKISEDDWQKTLIILSIGALVGARFWHVMTDFMLYQSEPQKVFYFWNGGLSIIGGVLFGAGALWYFFREQAALRSRIFDALIFGMPFAQALGRWGNYVNQELFGLPTSLPWGILIEPALRPEGMTQYSYYHPLFLYESIALFLFGVGLWIFYKRGGIRIGSGTALWSYVLYYGVLRFLLDFLRVDTAVKIGGLGINQFVLLIFIVLSVRKLYYER